MFEPGCGALADGSACAIGVSGRTSGACRATRAGTSGNGASPGGSGSIAGGTAATGHRCRTARQACRSGGNRHAASDRGGPPAQAGAAGRTRRARQAFTGRRGAAAWSRPGGRARLALQSAVCAVVDHRKQSNPDRQQQWRVRQPVLQHARRDFRGAGHGIVPPHSARPVGRQGPHSGERRRCGRRVGYCAGPRGADRSARDPAGRCRSRTGCAPLRLAGRRRRGRRQQQPDSDRRSSGWGGRGTEIGRDERQQGMGKRPVAGCGRPQRRRSRRHLRAILQRLQHPELSLSRSAKPRARRQRQTAEFSLAKRGSGGRRLLSVRRRLCRHRRLALHQRLFCSGYRDRGRAPAQRSRADQDYQQGRVSAGRGRACGRQVLDRIFGVQA